MNYFFSLLFWTIPSIFGIWKIPLFLLHPVDISIDIFNRGLRFLSGKTQSCSKENCQQNKDKLLKSYVLNFGGSTVGSFPQILQDLGQYFRAS